MAQGEAVLVHFDGAIGDFPLLIQALDGLIADGTRRIAVDLSTLAFINSAALGYLVKAHKTLAEKGGRLALVRLTPGLKNLLQMTALDEVLTVVEDDAAALEALGGAALTPRGWRT